LKINETVKEVYLNAFNKGLWDDKDEKQRERFNFYMWLQSEVTEAAIEGIGLNEEKEKEELADIFIMICSKFGREGWDLEKAVRVKMDLNKTRPYKHGKDKLN